MNNVFENLNNEDLVVGDDFPAHIRMRFTELAEELSALNNEIDELKERESADEKTLEADETIKRLEELGVSTKTGFESLSEKLEEIGTKENVNKKLIRLLCARDFLEKEISFYQDAAHNRDNLTERDVQQIIDKLNGLHDEFLKLKEGRLPESGATPHPKKSISDTIH